MQFLLFIIGRLRERSTWIGLMGLATALGVALNPEQVESIIVTGVAAASTVAVFTKDIEN